MSLLYRTLGHSFLGAVILMCVLGALVPAALRALGRAMFGPAVGRIAGWLAALDPLLVFFSGYVMTESLFTLVLLVALVASVSWLKRPSGARASRQKCHPEVGVLHNRFELNVRRTCDKTSNTLHQLINLLTNQLN